ncbi:hypothetical protein NB037_09140 [Rathayibacter sp. ZW T2_19]|uniref:Uncharacterized protein n=1 Tax=Rathayibacter rubneri TaxID=2950106 RepID=A0A9X2DXT7_9MICO|nr:hypothetical protein [Rathayibacter rubneri]MCM6762578.1 hypothetical protein [Rathayibacter rubneri]
MIDLNAAAAAYSTGLARARGASEMRLSTVRTDRWVQVVVIAVALVVVMGLLAAWWMVCQQRGMYPAMDMPSLQRGGTWKLYCRK